MENSNQAPQNFSKNTNRNQSLLQLAIVAGILVALNVLASFVYGHLDLTEDKRFTLTPATKKVVGELDDILYIESFLEGEFPAGFQRLQNALVDILDDFRSLSGNVEYQFTNPMEGSSEDIKARQAALKERGILPVNLQVKGDDNYSEKLIYPGVILRYKGREMPISILENQTPGTPQHIVLNNSISLLEYKLTNAIKKLKIIQKTKIAFTAGHGELQPFETADFETTLSPYYDFARLDLDSITVIDQQIKVLIVAKPRGQFTEKQKFVMDQYVMNGGKMLWLIDRLSADLDSMRIRPEYIPFDYPLNLEDQLFKYGARIQPNLVLDMQCSKIPMVVGMLGDQPQYDLRNWFYNPIITPDFEDAHPIVKNLDGIDFQFVNSIDTIRTKTPVKKTILLSSSPNTRLQFSPVRLSFEILRYKPEADKFNKPNQPVAVALEGIFPSLYENRVSEEMNSALEELGQSFKAKSSPTKMLVVSDGDVIRNHVDFKEKKLKPLGFNPYERYTFANKDFMVNAVEYLIDADGVIAARSKEVKLRLLDKERARDERFSWQALNLVLPIVLLLIFGFGFNHLRRKKYAI